MQLLLFIVGGISVLALAISDLWRRRDADSVLMAAWVIGPFVAAYLDWSVNARVVLPLIPAAAIVMARRLERAQQPHRRAVWALVFHWWFLAC